MPTLGELRQILDNQGKPICDSAGFPICGNCPPPGSGDGCAGCSEWVCETNDFCLRIYGLRNTTPPFHLSGPCDITVPMFFDCTPGGVQFRGVIAFPPVGGQGCVLGSITYFTIVCDEWTDPPNHRWILRVLGTDPAGPDDINFSIGPLTVACPKLTSGSFDGPSDWLPPFSFHDGGLRWDSLELTVGNCTTTMNCGVACTPATPFDPFEPPPEDVTCCDELFPFGSDPFLRIPGTMVGTDAGGGFEPGCSCATGTAITFWLFHFAQDRIGLVGDAVVCGKLLRVEIFCDFGQFNWETHVFYNGIEVTQITQVTPCTPGFHPNYLEIAVLLSPGSGGTEETCFGGILITTTP